MSDDNQAAPIERRADDGRVKSNADLARLFGRVKSNADLARIVRLIRR